MSKPTTPEVGPAFTAGPWTFEINKDTALVFVVDDLPGRIVVAEVSNQPETEANARLIAAAPDLLATLKRTAGWLDPDEHGLVNVQECRDDLAAAIAAIAKAEGR